MLYIFSTITIIAAVLILTMVLLRFREMQKGEIKKRYAHAPLIPLDGSDIESVLETTWDNGARGVKRASLLLLVTIGSGLQRVSRAILRLPTVRRLYAVILGEGIHTGKEKNGASLYLKHIANHKDTIRNEGRDNNDKKERS